MVKASDSCELEGNVSTLSINNDKATIRHWTRINNNSKLTQCQGCDLNNRKLNKKYCTSQRAITNLIKIQVDCTHNIRGDVENLILSLKNPKIYNNSETKQ